MKVIGLTGGIASGKSSVASLLRAFGADVLDSDAIVHDLLRRGKRTQEEIRRLFGDRVMQGEMVDRTALGRLVFADPAKRRQLEALIHPQVKRILTRQLHALAQDEKPVVFIEVPLLYEADWADWVDQVWLVYAPPDVQIARLRARTGFTDEEAESRLAAQWPWEEKRRRATRVIDNSGDWLVTQAQVASLCQDLLQEVG
ncbi:MAG: dephospho-CoA kinase [bacterium]